MKRARWFGRTRSWGPSLGLLLTLAAAAGPARAQCVPLPALLRAAAEPAFALDSLDAYLPAGQWSRHRPLPGSPDEPSWTHEGAGINPATKELLTDDAQLTLRRAVGGQPAGYDVLLKTTRRPCLGELRAALRRAGFQAEPVTCTNCEAERFVGPACTVTLFDQHLSFEKGNMPFPYVVSVRRTASNGSGSSGAAMQGQ